MFLSIFILFIPLSFLVFVVADFVVAVSFTFEENEACAHYIMVSKIQWQPFCLPPSLIHRMTKLPPKVV